MIKNKDTEICEKCGLVIEPLQGKSVKQTVVECDICLKGKKILHTFEHIICPEKVFEIPNDYIQRLFEFENKIDE